MLLVVPHSVTAANGAGCGRKTSHHEERRKIVRATLRFLLPVLVSALVLGGTPLSASALNWGSGGAGTTSNGTTYLNVYGIGANVYVYADSYQASGLTYSGKINSIYLYATNVLPAVEAGVMTDTSWTGWGGSRVFTWEFDVNGAPHGPLLFEWVNTGDWPRLQVRYYSQAQGATYPNTISVESTRAEDYTNQAFHQGNVVWGTERTSDGTNQDPPGGSFATSEFYNTSYSWNYLQYGAADPDISGSQGYDSGVFFDNTQLYTNYKAMFTSR